MPLATLSQEGLRVARPRPLWPRREDPWRPRRRHVLLGIVVVAVAATAAVFVLQHETGNRYQDAIAEITPYGPSQVIVTIQVTNLRSSAFTPTCRVDLNSPAFAFSGSGTLAANQPIPGGSGAEYDVIVPVTSGGSTHIAFATSNVNCW
jgi:hypothetical protein